MPCFVLHIRNLIREFLHRAFNAQNLFLVDQRGKHKTLHRASFHLLDKEIFMPTLRSLTAPSFDRKEGV